MPQSVALSRGTVLLMAAACGLCAGANYFNQPLLNSIALALGISDSQAAATVTIAQLSYALGLVFFVPLGDLLERRRLAVSLMTVAALGLLISGQARHFSTLAVGMTLTGLFSVAAQVLVPMAAALTDPARGGRVVGTMMAGLLLGILASRAVAGWLSELGGWNTVYQVAGVLMLAGAVLLHRVLPPSRNPTPPPGYVAALRGLLPLLHRFPRLTRRSLAGGMAFGSMSVLFSTMALMLAGPPHGMSDGQIGMVGLIAVAGAAMASVAGRWVDRGWGAATAWGCAVLGAIAWLLILAGQTWLWSFLLGVLLVDMAVQGVHIANQSIVYGLSAEYRSRLNACYMTLYFIGGVVGSSLGTLAWSRWGWPGPAAAGIAFQLGLLGILAWDRWRQPTH